MSRARRRADASRGGAPRATRAANVYIYTPISSDTRSHHTRPIAHERTTTATGDDTHARWARVPVYEDEKDHRDHRFEARARARARWMRFSKIIIISSRDRDADALVRLSLDDDDASSKPAIEGVAVAVGVGERASRESGGGERGRRRRRRRRRTEDADR